MCVKVMYMCVKVMHMCAKVMHMCVKVMYMCAKVMYMCAKGIDVVSVSTIFLLDFETVPTVWGHRGLDRLVIGLTTTRAISVYHH
jgi:hypothetical protein